jgi:hypothetical protein
MTPADPAAVTPLPVTATPRRDWAKVIRDLAMSEPCPIPRCGARRGECCVASGEQEIDYHLSRLDAALRSEMPHIRDARDERRSLRRRWHRAM